MKQLKTLYKDANNVVYHNGNGWCWDDFRHWTLTPLLEEEVQKLLDFQSDYGVARGFSYWRDWMNKEILADEL